MATSSLSLLGLIAWPWRKLQQGWSGYRRLYRGAPWWKKILLGISSFVGFLLVYCLCVQFNFLWLFGRSPSLNSIMNPKTAAASEIYSADGKVLGKYFSENRSPVPYDSISSAFIKALIATEDERFYSHHGVDFFGIFAAVKDAAMGRPRGASTITQQLVKNMFRVRTEYSTGLLGYIPGVKMLIMKSKEMIIATELEWFYTKEEILTMYANTVDFGSNAYGIKTAARTYFKTEPSQLKTEEAAVLVGLLKATTAYNPRLNPKRSLERRNVVLDNMVKLGSLSTAEAQGLKEQPIALKFGTENAFAGMAHYFRQAVVEEMKELLPDLDPYRDGLRIYTTLDSRMQRMAEEAVRTKMRDVQRNFKSHWAGRDPWTDAKGNPLPRFLEEKIVHTDVYKQLAARYPDDPHRVWQLLREPHPVRLFTYDGVIEENMSSIDSLRFMLNYMHAGFVALEPSNGHVKAYVGDIDFQTWQHDNVRQAHQPGSTFKLFVYATALRQGWLPSDARLKDEYIQMEVYDPKTKEKKPWRPNNANGRFSGANLSLRAAFAQSINTIAVKLGQEVGIDNVVQTAKDMGVKSPLQATPALALGASDATVMEMAGAYAAVANYGEYVAPTLITKILDRDGRILYEARPQAKTVMTEREAFYMQTLLAAGVFDGGGTSQRVAYGEYLGSWLQDHSLDIGGKTGTSNGHADAWFVGVTPQLVGAAWVGGEYRQIHFRTGALGQGSKTALPIFGLFMRKVLEHPELRTKYLARYRLPEGAKESELFTPFPKEKPVDTLQHDSLSIDADALSDEERDILNAIDNLLNDGEKQPAAPADRPKRDPNSPDLFE